MTMPPIVLGAGRKLAVMGRRERDPRRIDVAAACAQGWSLGGQPPLASLDRLVEPGIAAGNDLPVTWSATFSERPVHAGRPERWLKLAVSARVARECQRCLQPVLLPLAVDRQMLFVDDEAAAAELDAESEDDVLVSSAHFDLLALVEDELLLALPIVPRHDACPAPLPAPSDDLSEEPRANPFAAQAALKRGGGS
jgi:uncharacterized protein